MVALGALEHPHVVIGLVVRFDTSEPHLGPAFRAVGPFQLVLRRQRTLEPRLLNVELPFGTVVAGIGQPVSQVYFPHSGVLSLVVEMEVREMIETAMVGRDGVANAMAALNGQVSFHKAIAR
jgi:hypothetical protein